jgi:hypothetical protein
VGDNYYENKVVIKKKNETNKLENEIIIYEIVFGMVHG